MRRRLGSLSTTTQPRRRTGLHRPRRFIRRLSMSFSLIPFTILAGCKARRLRRHRRQPPKRPPRWLKRKRNRARQSNRAQFQEPPPRARLQKPKPSLRSREWKRLLRSQKKKRPAQPLRNPREQRLVQSRWEVRPDPKKSRLHPRPIFLQS